MYKSLVFELKGNLLHNKNEIYTKSYFQESNKSATHVQLQYKSLGKFNLFSLDQQYMFNMEVIKV